MKNADLIRISRLPALAVVATIAVAAVGCEAITQQPRATGRDSEIAVVIDSANWNGAVGEALRETLGGYIETLPAPENRFDLVRQGITTQGRFDRLQRLKNVVFVAPLSDSTAEARFLRSSFSEQALRAIREGEGGVVARDDPWRSLQKVYYIAAETPDDLVGTIRESAPAMVRSFNDIARRRMTIEMFEKARQFDLEQQLLDDHGFAVNVQHDYAVAVDTTNFVWLRRILSSDSWRSLFVHYVDAGNPALMSQDWIVAHRDSLGRRYIQGNLGGWVETDVRRPITSEQIELGGRFAVETRGLWQMVGPDDNGNIVQFGMGGPFVNYTIYDEATGRIFMLDGMVFAPGYSKRDFLRQLEVISYTFRTRDDVERASESVASSASTNPERTG